jgi:hypothetical protein
MRFMKFRWRRCSTVLLGVHLTLTVGRSLVFPSGFGTKADDGL